VEDIAIESDSSVGVDLEVASGALKSLGFIGFYATVKGWGIRPRKNRQKQKQIPAGLQQKDKTKGKQQQEQVQTQIPYGDDKQKGKRNRTKQSRALSIQARCGWRSG
jgi:hypothetical protein